MFEKNGIFCTKVVNKCKNIAVAAKLELLWAKSGVKVMSSIQTLEYVAKNQCAVARFGDGELNMIFRGKNIGFQSPNPMLAARLDKVLCTRDPNLLICLPHMLRNFDGERIEAREFWKTYAFGNLEMISRHLRKHGMGSYCFGDTQMTRPYIDYLDIDRAEKIYAAMKQIWTNRKLLIVEGCSTCMGVGNDLFDNAASVRRIVCPAENAFDVYEDILQTVLKKHDGELVLLALGPTATVLASELSQNGIWAIDVGHLDVEYEWFLSRVKEKTAIVGKYVNEVIGGRQQEACHCPEYLNQIIERIDV